MTSKRKGFTLVELLIVIVVIGILSAMMMMSSTEATTSAKASTIVSNLRNMKTAALAFYVDNIASVDNGDKTLTKGNVETYLGSSLDVGYDVATTAGTGGVGGQWLVKYTIKGSASEVSSIQNKLKARAKQVGLCNSTNAAVYNGEADVYMFVR